MSKKLKITTSVILCAALLFSFMHIGMFSAKGEKKSINEDSTNSSSVDGFFDMDGINIDWNKKLSYLGNSRYKIDVSIGASWQTKSRNAHNSTPEDSICTINKDGYYLIELYGGSGANGQATKQSAGGVGGRAGYVYGYMYLEEGQTLYSTLGGNGVQTARKADGGGANGDGGGHGDMGSYAVGGGGGYSSLFLFDKGEFEEKYMNPDGTHEKINESDRVSKYIMIASGGGGGGAGNERFFPAEGRPDGGDGGNINSLKGVLSGKPDTENIKGYSEMQAADAYVFGLCGEVTAKDGYVDVYFTSIEGNNAWLKIRILDENENIIAESGLIKPGQYIKSVKLNTEINSAINVTLKVMGYEPETYFSAGAVTLKTTLNV